MRCLTFLLLAPALFAEVDARIDARAAHFNQVSRRIWEHPETGYKEVKSSALLKDELRQAGFRIEENIAGIPTAFVATYGSGKPVIGLMAEYDALPGLSQDAVAERKVLTPNGPGHGCGHNLLGTASVLAAVALKDEGFTGTLKVFGTPAEEGGAGKVYMIRAGAFKDVDAVLAWHPADKNAASHQTSLANITAKFRFRGQPAHAAAAPEQGRSALDAVMLFNHAIDLLREHVPDSTRMHYIITQGGASPNIVPDFAEVFLYVRHPAMKTLDGIWKRIEKAAQGAALATETRTETEIMSSVYNLLPNHPLAALYDRHLRELGGLQYTADEKAFATRLRGTLFTEPGIPLGSEAEIQKPLEGVFPASTDAADVSWTVPTSQLEIATFPPGIALHTWQSTATAGMSIGQKGMQLAAKVLARTAADLYRDPKLLAAIRAAFDAGRQGFAYESRLPAGAKPPFNYRDNK